jgi:hypothetical protein
MARLLPTKNSRNNRGGIVQGGLVIMSSSMEVITPKTPKFREVMGIFSLFALRYSSAIESTSHNAW